MGKLSKANLVKTAYYLKRNGIRQTWYAARERLTCKEQYTYQPPTHAMLTEQMRQAKEWTDGPTFSIVVPMYRTPKRFLTELLESVCAQTYPAWELILADATEDESVACAAEELVRQAGEAAGRIRYIKLAQNGGISENTNVALTYATKEYVGLLDHDDLLTPDALYEMADMIRQKKAKGVLPAFLYSDEDKCDGEGKVFYEKHRKESFNYDLLLSNNYICHFLVMKRELIRQLGLRKGYDGAQDYDLILRAVGEIGIPSDPGKEELIGHVDRVLYHWRCHASSTAENPRSKEYAYEAGRRALQDHLDACGVRGTAYHLKHVGFYGIKYPDGALTDRADLGAVGGAVVARGRLIGGRMNPQGRIYYEKIPVHFSGYMHKAVLSQDAAAVDIRNIKLRRELWPLFEKITGCPYRCKEGDLTFDASTLPADCDTKKISLKLCKAIRGEGYRILWRREFE